MSFLVELKRSEFPDQALDGFAITPQFALANAQAMMWMSQLAYETADQKKVESILGAWHLAMRAFVRNDPISGLPPQSACVIAAEGRDATIVAFAGSDPLKIEDWITDFSPELSVDDLHGGFQAAVTNVWPRIKAVIENRPADEHALFFTGHSLGGALAVIAAERAVRELRVAATAVYTFGSPRTGGQSFFDKYTPALGNVTFRLIHGTDVVATVPPSLAGLFRHVGRAIQCPSGGRFDDRPPTAQLDGDEPDLVGSTLASVLADFAVLVALRPFRGIGPRPLDQLAGVLPRMARDHVPANYFRALSIPLE